MCFDLFSVTKHLNLTWLVKTGECRKLSKFWQVPVYTNMYMNTGCEITGGQFSSVNTNINTNTVIVIL